MFGVNSQFLIDAQHQAETSNSRWSIRIDAALDLGDPLLMPENHGRDGNRATHDDGHNRHQQSAQAYNRID
jgi:hypothetical protein